MDTSADADPAAILEEWRKVERAATPGPLEAVTDDHGRGRRLDHSVWSGHGLPPDSLKDTWKMPGFNPDEHEGAAGGCYVTPHLLDEYGPLTEMPGRKTARKEPDPCRG